MALADDQEPTGSDHAQKSTQHATQHNETNLGIRGSWKSSAGFVGGFRGMFEKIGTNEWEMVPWEDWPESSIAPATEPDPVPLHEREPGLLDEEVLPLFLDWEAGPIP